MKMYGREDVLIQVFLVLAIVDSSGQQHASVPLIPGKSRSHPSDRRLFSPRAGPDDMESGILNPNGTENRTHWSCVENYPDIPLNTQHEQE
jgi:hypothetical protein